MTKLNWLVVLAVVLVLGVVNGLEDKVVVDPKPESAQVEFKPVETEDKPKESQPIAQIEPANKMAILDAMNQKMEQKMFPFPFQLINAVRENFLNAINENNVESPSENEQVERENLPRNKILSILIIRHNNGDKTESSVSINQDPSVIDPESPINDQEPQVFSRAKFFFLPSIFSSKMENEELEDQEKKDMPLLGGRGDPDNSRFFDHQGFLSWHNQQPQTDDEQAQFNPDTDTDMNSPSQDTIRGHKKKKCMMLGFMRMKASVYYRTIVHLLFISGLILFVLLLSVLCIRVFKRRNARYHSQNINISTIDDGFGKKDGSLFRSDKQAESESYSGASLLISSPPAYDTVMSKETPKETKPATSSVKLSFKGSSSLINALALAYKNRYDRLMNRKEQADNKSVSSLPAYETATAAPTKDANVEQI